MRIWYLNHYAKSPSDGVWGRPYFLARELQAAGHDALLVAASDHHTRARAIPPEKTGQVLSVDDASFYFVRTRPYRGNGLGRYLNMMDFCRGIVRLGRRAQMGLVPKPDVIIASSAHIFVYPVAKTIARRLGVKLIFEVRDLWPLSLVEVAGVSPRHPLVWWMAQIEKDAYDSANAVVSLLPHALDHMVERGLEPSKFHWIPNGAWAREWEEPAEPLPAEHQRVIDEVRTRGQLVVLYAGAHGPPNAMEQVLELGGVTNGGATPRPYHIVSIGEGASKAALQARARDERLDFITFLPRVSKGAARQAILQADVCFIGWQDIPIYRFGISANKIFEYMMGEKPVVHAVRAGNDPVAEGGGGISILPNDPVALDAALRRMHALSPSERLEMGRRGRAHVLAEYEWSVLGRRYAAICEQLRSTP